MSQSFNVKLKYVNNCFQSLNFKKSNIFCQGKCGLFWSWWNTLYIRNTYTAVCVRCNILITLLEDNGEQVHCTWPPVRVTRRCVCRGHEVAVHLCNIVMSCTQARFSVFNESRYGVIIVTYIMYMNISCIYVYSRRKGISFRSNHFIITTIMTILRYARLEEFPSDSGSTCGDISSHARV